MNPSKKDPQPDPLTAIWRSEPSPAGVDLDDLRSEAARRRRKMVLVVVGEVLLTAGLIAWTVAVLLSDGPTSSRTVLWLAAAWLTWTVVAGFATWNRWGSWAATTESTRAYLALSEERARRRMRSAGFVLGLAAVVAAVALALGYDGLTGLVLLGLYAAWAIWYRHRARRDLDGIRRTAAEFGGEEGPV